MQTDCHVYLDYPHISVKIGECYLYVFMSTEVLLVFLLSC